MESFPEPKKVEADGLSPEIRLDFFKSLCQENNGIFAKLDKHDFLRFAGIPNELISAELNTVPFEERLRKAIDMGIINLIDGKSWSYHHKRPIVFTMIGNQNVPFYRSMQGTGGKKQAGTWYPFFGLGANGWLIKGLGSEYKSCYNNPILKKMQDILGMSFDWDHLLDLQLGQLDTVHPLTRNGKNLGSYCPPEKIDQLLFGEENLDRYYIEFNLDHLNWISKIMNEMYKAFPLELVQKIVDFNNQKLFELDYSAKEKNHSMAHKLTQ